jgi:multidrug resistance protein
MTGEHHVHHDTVETTSGQPNAQRQPDQQRKQSLMSTDLARIATADGSQDDDSRPSLQHTRSHLSHHDITLYPTTSTTYVEVNAAQYERFSNRRKHAITAILSLCGFLSPISSTTILAAVPEVASTFNTSGSIINLSNAMYMICMGLSPCLWGPISTIYGRRWPSIISASLFFVFSIGTAVSPNLASFFIFRMLTAYQGTSFLIVGNACIGDIYAPVERGTALSAFLSGTLIGPAFGPFVGGIIVTFCTWRDIFWLQTALGGLATLLVIFFLPETIPEKKIDELKELPTKQRIRRIMHWTSPIRVAVLLFTYPNLLIAGIASSSLVWNMYSLLTPIRYVLNPRFDLTSPIQSGLFYIAPGCGYLLGTFFGGRWADYIVKKHITIRGKRVPEDRLRSCYAFIGFATPACMLVYGWSVDQKVGGVPLPVAAMFIQGVSQLFCFPSLNTYCLDVMQARGLSAEVVAGNYMLRYMFAAAGSAICLPAIEAIGVGWFSTISSGFLVISGGAIWATTIWGEGWRKAVDKKKKIKKAEREQHRQETKGAEEKV